MQTYRLNLQFVIFYLFVFFFFAFPNWFSFDFHCCPLRMPRLVSKVKWPPTGHTEFGSIRFFLGITLFIYLFITQFLVQYLA